jgi:hypothetical protein
MIKDRTHKGNCTYPQHQILMCAPSKSTSMTISSPLKIKSVMNFSELDPTQKNVTSLLTTFMLNLPRILLIYILMCFLDGYRVNNWTLLLKIRFN